MKVTIEQVNMYTLTIDGVKKSGFEKTGEWEGMVKFKGPEGEVMVMDKEKGFANIFEEIFQATTKKQEISQEFDVIKLSANLMPENKLAE